MSKLSNCAGIVVTVGLITALTTNAGDAKSPDVKTPVKNENKNNAAVRAKLEKKISIDFVETPLHVAIGTIGELADVKIMTNEALAKDNSPITLRSPDREAGVTLMWVLKLFDAAYTIKDGTVIIHKKDSPAEGNVPVKPAKK